MMGSASVMHASFYDHDNKNFTQIAAGKAQLSADAAGKKYDRVRVICTQPYNKVL